jgi:hypothetical protein
MSVMLNAGNNLCRISANKWLLLFALAAVGAGFDGDAPRPSLLGRSGDWVSFASGKGTEHTCFARTAPTTREPENLKRDPGYLFVSKRPADGAENEVSVLFGYPLDQDNAPQLRIGGREFELFARDKFAWPRRKSDDSALVRLMQAGKDMTITSVSRRGNRTTNTYSLEGFSRALELARDSCR